MPFKHRKTKIIFSLGSSPLLRVLLPLVHSCPTRAVEGTPCAGWGLEDRSGETVLCFLLLRSAVRFS
ncbi:hypothetical protein SLEP1_g52984 [Rubroshorea leprosula]|uniref:Secreted protein n=1 Tax=Rubroshorea leprosula TaxID=152421 RepID=A0AAV5M8T4_9ROSI|nr:hypothetical protein SLEP1_g52984 [Rubroshorea leprosula]